MDIKAEIEKMIDKDDFDKIVSKTIPLIMHLKKNGIAITEVVLKYFIKHILSSDKIIESEKAEFEFYLRDQLAFNCEIFKMPILDVKEEKVVEKIPGVSSKELTPEMLAEMEKDLPPYVDPGPSEFYLELCRLLNKDESNG